MASYTTKQRKLLLDFLSAHADECLSAAQIAAALHDDGISASAVYRNLATLCDEGKVHKIARDESREVGFRYAADACAGCIHLSCRRCGKLFHMNPSGAAALIASVEREDAFSLDRTETVLYGLCASCRKG